MRSPGYRFNLTLTALLLGGCAAKPPPAPQEPRFFSARMHLERQDGQFQVWTDVHLPGADAAALAACEEVLRQKFARMPGDLHISRQCGAEALPSVGGNGVVMVHEEAWDLLQPTFEVRATHFTRFDDEKACAAELRALEGRMAEARDAAASEMKNFLVLMEAQVRRSEEEDCRVAAEAPSCQPTEVMRSALEQACGREQETAECRRVEELAMANEVCEFERTRLGRACAQQSALIERLSAARDEPPMLQSLPQPRCVDARSL
jgi:hypothetical protein